MLYVDKSFFMFRDRDGTEKIPSRKKSQDYRCSMVPQSGWKNNGHFYNSFLAATVNEFVYYRTNNPPVLAIPMIVLNCPVYQHKNTKVSVHPETGKSLRADFRFLPWNRSVVFIQQVKSMINESRVSEKSLNS